MALNNLGSEDSSSSYLCPKSNDSLDTDESIMFVSETNSELSNESRQSKNKNARITKRCIAKRDLKEKKIICSMKYNLSLTYIFELNENLSSFFVSNQ